MKPAEIATKYPLKAKPTNKCIHEHSNNVPYLKRARWLHTNLQFMLCNHKIDLFPICLQSVSQHQTMWCLNMRYWIKGKCFFSRTFWLSTANKPKRIYDYAHSCAFIYIWRNFIVKANVQSISLTLALFVLRFDPWILAWTITNLFFLHKSVVTDQQMYCVPLLNQQKSGLLIFTKEFGLCRMCIYIKERTGWPNIHDDGLTMHKGFFSSSDRNVKKSKREKGMRER